MLVVVHNRTIVAIATIETFGGNASICVIT